MHRRTAISILGGGLVLGTAGCLGGDSADGYYTHDGVDVPLVGTETALGWFDEADVAFFDARGQSEYEEVRIEGAEWSPAEHGRATDDPSEQLSTDDRIVTYCVCPHLLAGQRGASLLNDGFEEVYGLDEGLQGWIDAGGAIEGTETVTALEGAHEFSADYPDE